MESRMIYSGRPKESRPKISFVIPTYKRARFLENAIDSILCQENTEIPYEIIVVNNDPNDEMRELVAKYIGKPISFFSNYDNLGQVGNINQSISLANGKYVAILHDDDLLFPHYLTEIGRYLDRIDLDCLIPCYYEFYAKYQFDLKHKLARLATIWRLLYRPRIQKIDPEDYIYSFYDIYNAPTCGTIFLKQALINFGMFKDIRGAAWDYYNFRLFNQDHSIFLLHAFLGARRMYSGMSNRASVRDDFKQDKLLLLEELRDHRFIKKYYDCIKTRKPFAKWMYFKLIKILYIYSHNLLGSQKASRHIWGWLEKEYHISET